MASTRMHAVATLAGAAALAVAPAFAATPAPTAKKPPSAAVKAKQAKALCARIPVAATDPADLAVPRAVVPPGGRCEAVFELNGNVRLLLRHPDQRLWAEVFWGPLTPTRKGARDGVRYYLKNGRTMMVVA